jgi:hypothetical protein
LDWSIVTKNQRILDELERLVAIDVGNMDRDEKDEYVALSSVARSHSAFSVWVYRVAPSSSESASSNVGTRARPSRYIVQLAAAVRESDLFRIKTAVAEKGRQMLEKFVEERVPIEVKERMSVAKAEMNRDELEDILELCDAEG